MNLSPLILETSIGSKWYLTWRPTTDHLVENQRLQNAQHYREHSIFPLPSFLCPIQDSKNTVETGVERVKAEPMDAYKVSASSGQSRAAKYTWAHSTCKRMPRPVHTQVKLNPSIESRAVHTIPIPAAELPATVRCCETQTQFSLRGWLLVYHPHILVLGRRGNKVEWGWI